MEDMEESCSYVTNAKAITTQGTLLSSYKECILMKEPSSQSPDVTATTATRDMDIRVVIPIVHHYNVTMVQPVVTLPFPGSHASLASIKKEIVAEDHERVQMTPQEHDQSYITTHEKYRALERITYRITLPCPPTVEAVQKDTFKSSWPFQSDHRGCSQLKAPPESSGHPDPLAWP